MAKIIKIQEHSVIIGTNEGTTIEAPKTEFPFEIHELMEIDAHKHGDKYIFSKHISESTFLEEQEQPPIPGKKYVNKVTYGVLRLLLGTLGVHHFYAGNIGKGILTILVVPISFILMLAGMGMAYVSPLLGLSIAVIFGGIFVFFHLYLFITAIIILCKPANRYGNILIKGGR